MASMRVVVVGAGIAGLRTADLLVAAGHEVTVLEASARVGGRTFTRRDGFVDGQYAEAGAEWVDTVHERVHAQLRRFGARVDPQATTWTAVRRWLFRGGVLLGPDELHRIDPALDGDLDRFETALADIAVGIADPARPQDHPHAAEHDAVSIAALADRLDLGELAELFVLRNMQGEFADEPSAVSSLFVAQQRAVYLQADARHGTVAAQRVDGGISAIADGLAAALPAGVVRVGEPVVAVEGWDDPGTLGVTVRTSAGEHRADHVVLTASMVALRTIRFDPPLPADLRDAVDGLGYGTVTKTALQYPRRAWPGGYATTENGAQRVYEPTAGKPGDAGILMAYTGGDGGRRLAGTDEAARLAEIEAHERSMFPDLPKPVHGFSQAWSGERYTGGSYAVYRPGEVTRFWDVVRRPCGRLHLAGEHTATWTGYVEGALESAEVVVSRLTESG